MHYLFAILCFVQLPKARLYASTFFFCVHVRRPCLNVSRKYLDLVVAARRIPPPHPPDLVIIVLHAQCFLLADLYVCVILRQEKVHLVPVGGRVVGVLIKETTSVAGRMFTALLCFQHATMRFVPSYSFFFCCTLFHPFSPHSLPYFERARSRVIDCVNKQCRALQSSGWEKDAAAVDRLASASIKLVDLYLKVRN